MNDLGFQLDISLRLLVAAVLGAAIGFEREVHGHPAGMRTHLLVSLGSALFTVLSIFGFPPAGGGSADTARVAAQVVSGIGFLGAGAIIKEGFSVRGLTTAASLWATAAVGMGAGAAQLVIALVATAIILFSLWPLRTVAERIHGLEQSHGVIRLVVRRRDSIADVSRILTEHGVEIVSVETSGEEGEGYGVEIGVRLGPGSRFEAAVARVRELEGVDSAEAAAGRDA